MKTNSIYNAEYKDEIAKIAQSMLTKKRLKHTLGVIETGIELAKIYSPEDEALQDKVFVASYLHDIFRGRDIKELNDHVVKYNLDPKRYLNNSNLAHGKLAYCYMKDELGIQDADILNAVSYHTTGRKGMSLLEKIIFAADAIEPGRDYPGLEEIREASFRDIDEGCLMSLESTVEHLRSIGFKDSDMDIDTMEAIEDLKKLIELKNA